MEIGKPCLFLELNDEKFILAVAQYDNDLNYKILDSTEAKSEGILNGKIIDIEASSNILKDIITSIEKDGEKFIGHTFKGKYLDCGTMAGYLKSSLEISKI